MVEVNLVVKYSIVSNGDIGLRVDNLRLAGCASANTPTPAALPATAYMLTRL